MGDGWRGFGVDGSVGVVGSNDGVGVAKRTETGEVGEFAVKIDDFCGLDGGYGYA